MRRLISFLGVGPEGGYREVTYFWDESIARRSGYRDEKRELTTSLFPLVAFEIAQPDELVLFCTKDSARRSTAELGDGSKVSSLSLLRNRLGDKLKVEEIPSTSNAEDLWKMFEAIDSAVGRGDEILMDVTHSFRFIPLMSLAVVHYLTVMKEVRVVDVLYGAFDAKDEHSKRAPVYSLLGFFDVVSWTEGLKLFKERFDASALARKLREIQGEGSSSVRLADQAKVGWSSRLREVSDALDWLSASMSSSNLMGVSESAFLLGEKLEKAKAELDELAKPFRAVLSELKDDLRRFSLRRPEVLTPETLRAQLEIVKRMFRAGLYLQTALALKEWLVSWAMLMDGLTHAWLDWDRREEVSKYVGTIAKANRSGKAVGLPQSESGLSAKADPQRRWELNLSDKDLLELWKEVTDLRNDLAHCGIAKRGARSRGARELRGDLARLLKSAEKLLERVPKGIMAEKLSEIELKERG